MTETYYRYHPKACAAGHSKNSTEASETNKKWLACSCAIYFYGNIVEGEKPKKQSTGARSYDDARAVVKNWRAAGSRPAARTSRVGTRVIAPPAFTTKGAGSKIDGLTIEAAAAAYLAAHADMKSAKHTIKIKRLMLGKLKQFSYDVRGYTHLRQWKREDVEAFLGWWECSLGTTGKNWSQVKAFFEFFVGVEGGVTHNVARFKMISNRAVQEAAGDRQKSPFSDEELALMIRVARESYGKRLTAEGEPVGYHYSWSGEDLVDFIYLSVYTGLRISDIATFNIDQIAADGSVHFRALKNGTYVDTWIPEWLHYKMRNRAAEHGKYIFGYTPREGEDMDVVTDLPRRKLNRLWDLCGEWEENPTHHRFRHTFVRVLLEDHVPVERIALLLGDTVEVVRASYSKWVPKHQEEIRADLEKAFAKMPDWA